MRRGLSVNGAERGVADNAKRVERGGKGLVGG